MAQVRPHAEVISNILARSRRQRHPIQHTTLQASILHTYRHILREVSYLPPSIRQNIRSPIIKRFKQHKISGPHDSRQVKRAHQGLRTLRAAHAGDKAAYLGLIQKAFGRSWIRRHTLMDENYLKKEPQDSTQLEDALNKQAEFDTVKAATEEADGDPNTTERRAPKQHGFERWDLNKLMHAMQSQKRAQGNTAVPTWPLHGLGNLDPDSSMAEKNIWEKPLSERVVSTRRAKWWDKKITRVEPPLEKEEWELLGKLAQGLQETDDAWKLPKRRAPAKPINNIPHDKQNDSWDWERHASQPISEVEKSKSTERQLRSGERPSGPFGHVLKARMPSPRWFRRAYEQTWMVTPYVEKDLKSSKLLYKWGGVPSRAKVPSSLQMSVFEGVDASGRPNKAKS